MSNAMAAPRWWRRRPPARPRRRPASRHGGRRRGAQPPAPSTDRRALHGAAAALPAASAPPVATPDMGFLHFVAQSDFVGKSLFVILILMSLVTWYLILVKVASNVSMRKRSRDFLNKFWNASSLEQVENEIVTRGARDPFSHLASHAMHAQAHPTSSAPPSWRNLAPAPSSSPAPCAVIDEETAKLENGLTVLASVGSTAPFVGLFGTVWGVYHALVGIGLSDGVTINRIAGPVGEALIMTGLGLGGGDSGGSGVQHLRAAQQPRVPVSPGRVRA